ncbi:MAG: ribbon-helix-helix protein, CopG family [Pseudomonadota bacterium]|nr:ribbon-helix-helix protein, CopG family [Pseudomonadota bacterium]
MSTQLVRTQIYLSVAQQEALGAVAARRRVPKSEVIREVLDEWVTRQASEQVGKLSLLRSIRGMWADREDMQDSVAWVNKLRSDNEAARQQSLQAARSLSRGTDAVAD